jgi:urocanate hydratase
LRCRGWEQDGSDRADRKLARVFTSDPALVLARYAHAAYEEAAQEASRAGLGLCC